MLNHILSQWRSGAGRPTPRSSSKKLLVTGMLENIGNDTTTSRLDVCFSEEGVLFDIQGKKKKFISADTLFQLR